MPSISVKLAWRNLWRNARRTWLTILPISFTVFLAVFLHSQQAGLEKQILETLILPNFGHLQIQAQNTVAQDTLAVYLAQQASVQSFTPRIENFGQIKFKNQIRNVVLLGISPTLESNFSQLEQKITQGHYLNTQSGNGVLIAEGLANQLKINLLDSIHIFPSVQKDGISQTHSFLVKGLVKLATPEANENTLILPIKEMSELFPSLSNTYLVKVKSAPSLPDIQQDFKKQLAKGYLIKSWSETAPDLAQMIQADQVAGWFLAGIFYLLCGFNVFGTILMILNERRSELSLFKTIGMKSIRILQMIYTEIVMLTSLGIIIGLSLVLPLVLFLETSPLLISGSLGKSMQNLGFEAQLSFQLKPSAVYWPVSFILITVILSAWYPWQIVRNLTTHENLRT
jgi:ABC-type lipoprotein release transport system permease subunit